MKKSGTIITALLAVLAIVFAILFFTGNGDKSKLTDEKGALAKQVEDLTASATKAAEDAKAELDKVTADAAKSAEDAKAQIETLTGEKDELTKQVETLTADASKAAEDAQAQVTALTGEKDELAKKVETLTAEAATKAEEAKATLESKVAEAKEAAQGKIDELTKKVDELTKSLDFANLDEKGIKDVVTKLISNPKAMKVIPDLLKGLGIELPGTDGAKD